MSVVPNLHRASIAAVNHPTVNPAIAIFVGVYLLVALYQGNLGALATQAKADFLGGTDAQGNATPGFWRWAAALIVLIYLSQNPATSNLFGPLLAITLVAMLINIASTQPGLFQNLNNGIAAFFGRATTTGA